MTPVITKSRIKHAPVVEENLVACIPSFVGKKVTYFTSLKKRFVLRSTLELKRDLNIKVINVENYI